jgi:hypothetical protein
LTSAASSAKSFFARFLGVLFVMPNVDLESKIYPKIEFFLSIFIEIGFKTQDRPSQNLIIISNLAIKPIIIVEHADFLALICSAASFI